MPMIPWVDWRDMKFSIPRRPDLSLPRHRRYDRRNDAVKLYCVERTAKEGGHASCGARDASAGCNGVEKTYSYNGPDIPEGLAEDPRVKKLMDRVEKEQKAFDKEDRKSLVEVTGQAVSASRRGIRNMRASIGGREEPEHSPAPSNPPPAGVASQDPLPEMPGEATPALPLSAAEQPRVPSAAMAPAESAAQPARKSRVKSIATLRPVALPQMRQRSRRAKHKLIR